MGVGGCVGGGWRKDYLGMITYLTIPYLPGMYVCTYVCMYRIFFPLRTHRRHMLRMGGRIRVRAYVHGCMRAADEGRTTDRPRPTRLFVRR